MFNEVLNNQRRYFFIFYWMDFTIIFAILFFLFWVCLSLWNSVMDHLRESYFVSKLSDDYYSACGCGFFCNQTCNSHLFAIFSLSYDNDVNISKSEGPKVVRSANPENPVSINATFQLSSKKRFGVKRF